VSDFHDEYPKTAAMEPPQWSAAMEMSNAFRFLKLNHTKPVQSRVRIDAHALLPLLCQFHKRILGFGAAIVVAVLSTMQPARAELVTIAYEAEVKTVTGQPFGMTVPLLTFVKGYFTYDSNTSDKSPTDPMRGSFGPVGGWGFRAEFIDKVITDSGVATASTNLFGSPTLRFNDGGNTSGRGIMQINGTADDTIELGFAISGATKDLPTDALPANFTFDPPPDGASHTFSLKDQSGTMLLGFLSFRQVRPEILSIQRTGDEVEIIWSSVIGKPYALEFSTNLQNWTVIRNDLLGSSQSTGVVDNLAIRFPENKPTEGFYRILDRVTTP
jgi:hypothetical protein